MGGRKRGEEKGGRGAGAGAGEERVRYLGISCFGVCRFV